VDCERGRFAFQKRHNPLIDHDRVVPEPRFNRDGQATCPAFGFSDYFFCQRGIFYNNRSPALLLNSFYRTAHIDINPVKPKLLNE
jgi:hypothetical protein